MGDVNEKDEAAQEPGWGKDGITPHPNSNPLRSGGEDTTYVSLWVDWGPDWASLKRQLEIRRERAQELAGLSELVRNEVVFGIRPSGYRMGGKGVSLPFVVEHQGISIGIADTQVPMSGQANVDVRIGSLPLMEWGGLDVAWPVVRELILRLGGQMLRNQVRRMDMCGDMAGVGVEDFEKLISSGHLITRVRKQSWHKDSGRWEGFKYGKNSISIRIYDKIAESKCNTRKLAALICHRWGELPSKATRIECQVRGPYLLAWGIVSVEAYVKYRGGIAQYLTQKWWRISDCPVDRTNTSRAKLHPLWCKVVDAFSAWTGTEATFPAVRSSGRCDGAILLRQAVGCIGSMVVVESDGRAMTDNEFIKFAATRFHKMLRSIDIQKLLREKRKRWMADGPSEYSTDWQRILREEEDDAA